MPRFDDKTVFKYLDSVFGNAKKIDMRNVWAILGREFGFEAKEAYEMGKKWLSYVWGSGYMHEKAIKLTEKNQFQF